MSFAHGVSNNNNNNNNNTEYASNSEYGFSSESEFTDEEYDSVDDKALESSAEDDVALNNNNNDNNNNNSYKNNKDPFADLSRHELDQKLSLIVKALGFKSNPKGVCAGFAGMGLQALFIRDTQTLEGRANLIKTIPYPIFRDLRSILMKSLNEVKPIAQQKFSSASGLFNFDWLAEDERNQYKEYLHHLLCENLAKKVNQRTKTKKITNDEANLLISMITFCGSLDVIQTPYSKRFMTFFSDNNQPSEQDLVAALNLVQPDSLQNKGGVKKIAKYTGVYSVMDLQSLFAELSMHIKNSNESIAFLLQNTNHDIAFSYEPITDEWIVIDSIGLRILRTKNEKEIATSIVNSFSQNQIATFSTSIVTTTINEEQAYDKINSWINSNTWQAIHDPKAANRMISINAVDSDGYSWLFAAVEHGIDTAFIQTLIDNGADINQYNSFYDATPIIIAVEKCLYEHVELLLINGCISDVLTDKGLTLLEYAAAASDARMVKLLLKYGVKAELDVTKLDINTITHEISALISNAQTCKPIIDQLLEAGSIPSRIKVVRELYETMLIGDPQRTKAQVEHFHALEDLAARLNNDSDREELYSKYLTTKLADISTFINSYDASAPQSAFKKIKP